MLAFPLQFLTTIGRTTRLALAATGQFARFTASGLRACVQPPFYPRLLGHQLLAIGYYSLPVVGMTAMFTGMVLALQIYLGSARFNAESAVASIVVIGITRELGPVIAGLMVAGRVGAAIAAEIGTMRVTEQIDALETLSTDPFRYLVAPRLIAAAITMPMLVLIGDIIGVFGAYVIGVNKLGFAPTVYIRNTWDFLEVMDVVSGLVKASVFGFIIALMGCYYGYQSRGGAQGVGAATTSAVVTASILLIGADYLLSEMFFAQ